MPGSTFATYTNYPPGYPPVTIVYNGCGIRFLITLNSIPHKDAKTH
jgi:hypothetical protein